MKKQIILCPVDFSGSSGPAVELAARLAVADQSKLLLLHVHEPKQTTVSLDEAQLRGFKSKIEDESLSRRDIEFEHVALHGKPAEVIVDYARKRSAELIVMGTHGRTGLASVVVGSIARKVMADATCPVVTVKMPAK